MKKKLLTIILLIIVLIPSSIKAATGSLKITCDKVKVKAGGSTTCTISGTTDSDVIGVSASLDLSDNLIFTSFEKNNSWTEGSIENNKLDIYSEDYINNNFTIGTMVITTKSGVSNINEKITLKDITFQNDKSNNAEENSYSVSDSNISIRIPNDDNTLKSLTVSDISFIFNKNNTSYQLETEKEEITISATASDSNATISGDTGTKKLNYGGNNFSIKVTSEAGEVKEYTLNIVRPDNRSKENYLISFKFNNYDIDFSKDKTDYKIALENDIKTLGVCNNKDNTLCINLDSIKVSDKSTYTIMFNNESIDKNNSKNINVGSNTLTITVTAENEGKRVYTFNINRKSLEDTGKDYDKTNDEITTNGKTGDALVIGIIGLLIISFGVTIYIYKKN